LWLNGASYSKITIDSIGSRIGLYEIDWYQIKMNDLYLCSEGISKSCQPLRYIQR